MAVGAGPGPGGGGGGARRGETVAGVLREYAEGSTLHGVRYITQGDTCFFYRFCWSLAVLACAGLSVGFVTAAWESFLHSPTVTTVENTHYPLHAFPFPAVTVCSANRVRRSLGIALLRRFLEERWGRAELPRVEAQLNRSMDGALLEAATALSFYYHPRYYRMHPALERLGPLLPLLDTLNITDYMLKVVPRCQTLFYECFWQGMEVDCCEVFRLQRTEVGFCYSFNSLTAEATVHCPESLGGAGLGGAAADPQPGCRLRRCTSSGIISGLEVFLAVLGDADELPDGRQPDRKGFRVSVHHPSDMPAGGLGRLVSARRPAEAPLVFSLAVSAAATASSPGLRGLQPAQRHCYFPDEFNLTIFHTYTLQNCMLECRQRFLVSQCGCRTYFFADVSRDFPECNFTSLKCLANQTRWLRFLRAQDADNSEGGLQPLLDCSHCLPTCDDMRFDVDAAFTEDTTPIHVNTSGYLDVFYKELSAVKYRRDIAFGTTQLVVSFGGIMGLFLGVSLLSGAELLYYLIRLLVAGCRRLRRVGSVPAPELPVRRPVVCGPALYRAKAQRIL